MTATSGDSAGLEPLLALTGRRLLRSRSERRLPAIVTGPGIMGERLAGGNDAMALLGNTWRLARAWWC